MQNKNILPGMLWLIPGFVGGALWFVTFAFTSPNSILTYLCFFVLGLLEPISYIIVSQRYPFKGMIVVAAVLYSVGYCVTLSTYLAHIDTKVSLIYNINSLIGAHLIFGLLGEVCIWRVKTKSLGRKFAFLCLIIAQPVLSIISHVYIAFTSPTFYDQALNQALNTFILSYPYAILYIIYLTLDFVCSKTIFKKAK